MSCRECLFELDFLLLCEAPATPEEEVVLSQLPEFTVEGLLTHLSCPRAVKKLIQCHGSSI